ncbi:hypothetical protein P9112_014336 [Eukaryota sp. TZLM1-RC]
MANEWHDYDSVSSALAENLTATDLSKRPGPGGSTLTYLEGWKVVRKANEIFGFDGWTTEVRNIEVDYIDENNGRFSCGVSALLRVALKTGSYHEDIGYGTAESQRSRGSALSLAKKEAITDGVKRALRYFGSALGNSVYDKDHIKDVWRAPQAMTFSKCEPSTNTNGNTDANITSNPNSNLNVNSNIHKSLAKVKPQDLDSNTERLRLDRALRPKPSLNAPLMKLPR